MNLQQGVRTAWSASQRGQFFILMVLFLALGTGFLIYSMAAFRSIDFNRSAQTDAALSLARDALLGRALSDANRPGSLPCPDVDDDGKLTLGVDFGSGGACTRYIGRLPWKTLELPELRDGDGEHLWYALSPAFSDTTTNAINTDSIGSITAYSGSNTAVISNRAVAVVFSAGAPLGSQARSPTQTAVCPMTGTTIAQSLCPNNYLETESVSGINNASSTGPYITVAAKSTFNDRLLVVSDSVDLMTRIESRAAQAILSALQSYRAGLPCNCYPWADVSNGTANDGLVYGRVPLVSADTGHSNDWSDAGVTVPQWLIDNKWWLVFFYTVGSLRTYDHDPSPGLLVLDGSPTLKDVILISAGAATAPRSTFPDDYIDDGENADNGFVFMTPSDTTSKNRDRLYSIP